MISRMNKLQRIAIINLIEAVVRDHRETSGIEETIDRRNAEEAFHQAFKNENELEDDHNHVG